MRKSLLIASLLLAPVAASGATPPDAARQLAEQALVVDTHIDAPGILLERWADLGVSAPDREFDYPRARAGGLDVAFMSIYTSPAQDTDGSATQVAHAMIDGVEALVQRHPDKFALLRSPGDVDRLRAGHRVLLALGMENGAPLGDDLAQLQRFHARGVRYITLAHSAANRIADSSYALQPTWNGLSPYGRRVVAEMNRLGIMVDVSHLSDAAARDAIAASRVPVIASHSAFRHFTPDFERNISDALARDIARRGGVVQVPFGTAFIDPRGAANTQAWFRAVNAFDAANMQRRARGEPEQDRKAFDAAWQAAHPPPQTSIEAVLDQIDHGVALIGIDHVGIGSDFDGVDGELPDGLRSVADYPNLVAGLLGRGYDKAAIGKILGGNLLRTWTAIEAGSAQGR